MYIIRINGNKRCLVNKRETYKNLKAVDGGRRWAGKWYGIVLTKATTYETKEEAEREVERLSSLTNLSRCFSKFPTYEIIEIN